MVLDKKEVEFLNDELPRRDWSLEQRKNISKGMSSTGIFRVTFSGGYWRYQYTVSGERRVLVHKDLKLLEGLVKVKGLEWCVLDDEKARKSYEK